MNVCSKVQDLKEPPPRERQSFCRIQRIGFFEKATRRLITIYRDEPSHWNTSELLKAFCVCVCICVCMLWRRVLSQMINYFCDTKKFCLDAWYWKLLFAWQWQKSLTFMYRKCKKKKKTCLATAIGQKCSNVDSKVNNNFQFSLKNLYQHIMEVSVTSSIRRKYLIYLIMQKIIRNQIKIEKT